MEDAAGWKVLIAVPHPNGRHDHHLWVAAIPGQEEVRARLLLSEIPCEAHLESLSAAELGQFGLEAGEVRRILLPSPESSTTDDTATQVEEPESKSEEHAFPAADSTPRDVTTQMKNDREEWQGEADLARSHPKHEVPRESPQQLSSAERVWRRLWADTSEKNRR